jgi:hypothetical protein
MRCHSCGLANVSDLRTELSLVPCDDCKRAFSGIILSDIKAMRCEIKSARANVRVRLSARIQVRSLCRACVECCVLVYVDACFKSRYTHGLQAHLPEFYSEQFAPSAAEVVGKSFAEQLAQPDRNVVLICATLLAHNLLRALDPA